MPTKPTISLQAAALRLRSAAERREFGVSHALRPMMTELYRRAEVQLAKGRKHQKPEAGAAKPAYEPERLLHELQVHQVELEMQNAELQEARDRTEVLLENYTELYDFAPVGFFTLAVNGTIRQVNLTGARLIGHERFHLVGRSIGRHVAAGSQSVFHAFLKSVFAGDGKQSCEVTIKGADESLRAVNIEARRSPDGEECRAAVMDITERRLVEDAVRISEIRYRRLFEAAHDGVLLIDPGTRQITDANPFMTKLLGYSHGQLVGKELFEIGLLKDEAASQEMFLKLKKQHEVRYENLPLETQKGRHQEVEVVANLYEEDGHSVIQCNIRDITERKQAERDVRESEERYRVLFELGPVAVYSCDAEGKIQNFNKRAAELWGRKPSRGESKDRFCGSFKLFRPDGRLIPHERCPMADMLSGKIKLVRDQEVVIERPDASRLNCVVNIRLLKNERGEVTGAINCFYDITARKRAEETQRRIEVLGASNRKLEQEIVRRQAVEEALKKSEQHQRRLLEQSNQQQGQLRELSRQILSAQEEERRVISRELHDVIAQTLTGINFQLSALKQEAVIDIKGLDRNIALTQRLVEKSVEVVHRFARELRPAVLDDLGLIPALHSFMKSFTTRTGVRTSLTAYAKVEQLDIAQRTVLFRVAQEALNNVARHAQASRVEVNIQKLPGGICMNIADDGKSFDVERVLHGKGRKRLGLLGMRERLEMVGGKFTVESATGRGTTIQAHIPRGKPGRRPRGLTKSADLNH